MALLPPKTAKDPIQAAGPEVLVIDGNEEHQMLSAMALSRQGFRVTAASSGREGLRIGLSKPFDAIVLDSRLRDTTAMDVLKALVERLPKVPKIYVVAPGAENLAVKALDSGATGYLVKTANYNEVLSAEVRGQIEKARVKARLEEHQRAHAVDMTERKKAEEALRESEERLRLLVAQAPFALWTTDPDLRFTSVLGAGQRLGLFGAQPLGQTVAEVLGATDPTLPLLDAHRRALTGEVVRFEQEVRGRTYDVYVEPLRTKDGPVLGVLGVALDVSERIRSGKTQSAVYRISQATTAAENLTALFGSIHQIVSELMPASNFYIALHDPDGDVLTFPYFVDEEEESPPPQPVGRGLTEYVLRTGRALLASPEVFNALLKAGEVEQIGPPSIDWLGVPLVAKAQTIGVLVVQSYTEGVRYSEADRELLKFVSNQIAMAIERKRAEADLREGERALATFLSNLPGMAYRCRNDPDWTDEFVSEGSVELLGMKPEEFIGRKRTVTYASLIHPDDRDWVWSEVQAAVQAGRPFRLRYRVRTAKGEEKWVWEQGRGIRDPSGKVVALEGFVTDIPDLGRPGKTAVPAETSSPGLST